MLAAGLLKHRAIPRHLSSITGGDDELHLARPKTVREYARRQSSKFITFTTTEPISATTNRQVEPLVLLQSHTAIYDES